MALTLLRKSFKASVLPAGLTHARRETDFTVCLYHRVRTGTHEIDVPPKMFERQIAYLARYERVIRLDEALSADLGGVVVTFDDGYRDFYDKALPILLEHRIPSTLYLTTSLVSNKGADDRLSWKHLQEAVKTGLVTIGAHTHAHLDLSKTSKRDAERDLAVCKELIEDHLQQPCLHFAYPWAVSSPTSDEVVRNLFASAAVHAWRTNRRAGFDPFELGRVPILRSDGRWFFAAKVKGMLDAEAIYYRLFKRGPWKAS